MPKGKGGASGSAHGKGSGKAKDAPSEGTKGGKKSGAGTAVKVSQFCVHVIKPQREPYRYDTKDYEHPSIIVFGPYTVL